MTGPVYFLSHGGPPTLFDTSSPLHQAWQRTSVSLLGDIENGAISKSKGLVCVSAHWENEQTDRGVLINVDEENPLIYDFYNFPPHYYEQTFVSRSKADNVKEVGAVLHGAGIPVAGQRRGLDHGLWVPFKIIFSGATDIPILQVSLPVPRPSPSSTQARSDADRVYAEEAVKLGRVLHELRTLGYGIVASGQPVHNLRQLFAPKEQIDNDAFNTFFTAASSAASSATPAKLVPELFTHQSYRTAHPTAEHLIPLAVAAGAVEGRGEHDVKPPEVLFADGDGPLGSWIGRWD